MGGKRHKPKNRNRVKGNPLQGQSSDQQNIEVVSASRIRPQNHPGHRDGRYPKKRRDWVLIVAVIGTIGTLIAVVLAYKSFILEHDQPDLGIHVYKVQGNQEYWYDSICIDQESTIEQENLIEFEVPLKIINHSSKDADNITVWITPETKGVELVFPNGGRIIEKYANQDWSVMDSDSLSPETGAKYHGIMLRAPKELHEAKLIWKIYATRMSPKKGFVSLCF